jgi:tetratricopeptide (TPR) repeat protein
VRKRVAVARADALRRLGRTAAADAEAARAAGLPADTGWVDQYVLEVAALQVGPDAEIRQGTELLGAGRPAQAIVLLQRASLKARNPTPARLLLGRALNEGGDPRAARQVLLQVVRDDAESVDGWFQLGNANFLLGDWVAAADAYERTVARKPDHAIAHYNLGHTRKKLGERVKAEAAFEAAIRSRPDYEDPRKALADLRAGK